MRLLISLALPSGNGYGNRNARTFGVVMAVQSLSPPPKVAPKRRRCCFVGYVIRWHPPTECMRAISAIFRDTITGKVIIIVGAFHILIQNNGAITNTAIRWYIKPDTVFKNNKLRLFCFGINHKTIVVFIPHIHTTCYNLGK